MNTAFSVQNDPEHAGRQPDGIGCDQVYAVLSSDACKHKIVRTLYHRLLTEVCDMPSSWNHPILLFHGQLPTVAFLHVA
jgi:hypothetical protein